MSMFIRPDSPPPRQPSPDIIITPLPSPYRRARLSTSSSSQSQPGLYNHSPLVPPGLNVFPRHKPLHAARSHDNFNERSRWTRPGSGGEPERKRTRSNLTISPPATPPSLLMPSPSNSTEERRFRRGLSTAVPYLSPPPSPIIFSPPPPVPPIPAFVLTPPPDATKFNDRPQPLPITPIRLAELSSLSPVSETSASLAEKLPPLDKHKSVGLTCLKFFSLRNSSRKARMAVA